MKIPYKIDNRDHLILLGPPGCGKGTQAKKLVEYWNTHGSGIFPYIHISTGDLLREINYPLGTGELVGDDVVLNLVRNKIEQNPDKTFIFDGFPRTMEQALQLSTLVHIGRAILIEVPDEDVVKRLVNRGISSGRADDDANVIPKRLEEYNSKTTPLINFYAINRKLRIVDGTGDAANVFNEIFDSM